jgi:hypothetical protein
LPSVPFLPLRWRSCANRNTPFVTAGLMNLLAHHDNNKTIKNPLDYLLAHYRGGQVCAFQWVLCVYMKKKVGNINPGNRTEENTELIFLRGKTAAKLRAFAKKTGREPNEVLINACSEGLAKNDLLSRVFNASQRLGLETETLDEWFISRSLDFKGVIHFGRGTFHNGTDCLNHGESLFMNSAGDLLLTKAGGYRESISLRESVLWLKKKFESDCDDATWEKLTLARYLGRIAGEMNT